MRPTTTSELYTHGLYGPVQGDRQTASSSSHSQPADDESVKYHMAFTDQYKGDSATASSSSHSQPKDDESASSSSHIQTPVLDLTKGYYQLILSMEEGDNLTSSVTPAHGIGSNTCCSNTCCALYTSKTRYLYL